MDVLGFILKSEFSIIYIAFIIPIVSYSCLGISWILFTNLCVSEMKSPYLIHFCTPKSPNALFTWHIHTLKE